MNPVMLKIITTEGKELKIFSSSYIPRKDEMIYIGNNKPGYVTNVTWFLNANGDTWEWEVDITIRQH